MSETQIEPEASEASEASMPVTTIAPAIDLEKELAAVIKLEGEHNYDAWLKSVTEYCQSRDIASHLDGTATKPAYNKRTRKGTKEERMQAYNEQLKVYLEKEGRLKDLLVHTTKAVAPYVYGWHKDYYILPNQKILEEIRTICCEPSASNRTAAMDIFLKLEPTKSAQYFFAELDALLHRMKVRYDIDIPDSVRVPYVLTKLSLDPAYLTKHCTGWEALQDKDLSYNDLVAMCLRQDKVLPLVAAPGEARQTYAER